MKKFGNPFLEGAYRTLSARKEVIKLTIPESKLLEVLERSTEQEALNFLREHDDLTRLAVMLQMEE